ncbi:hypothetical protein KFL_003700130 [Klebsormidium nitens]|uniref:PHD-type domain-containing protein n=1 Tax=Klebsormidium nitens TaxID=105231 RepID=A0A1Y1IAV2_KLENI|nr:hypothetical protein KFL_003700130 [Klebsormidium nitens]|eukprot:GAQ87693.1 hypothetical protein KFL_003700130 [Klebsormidium nitens]
MAQPVRQEVFFVFVPGRNGEEHCLPCLGKPEADNVRSLRKSIGKKARSAGALARSHRVSALKLVFADQLAVELVNSEPLTVLTTIFQNTSGEQWRRLGSGVQPRLVAVVKEKGVQTPETRGPPTQTDQAVQTPVRDTEGPVRRPEKRQREERVSACDGGPQAKRPKSTGADISGKANQEGAPRESRPNDASQERDGRNTESGDGVGGREAQRRSVGNTSGAAASNLAAGVEGAKPDIKRKTVKKVKIELSESSESEHPSRAEGGRGGSDVAGEPQQPPGKAPNEARAPEGRSGRARDVQSDCGVLKQEEGVERRGVVRGEGPKVDKGGGRGIGGGASREPKRPEAAVSHVRTKEMEPEGSEVDADACDECGNEENPELLVRCAEAECATVAHIYCISEEMDEVPGADWFCDGCEERNEADKTGGHQETTSARRGVKRGEAESVERLGQRRTIFRDGRGGGRGEDVQRNGGGSIHGKVARGGSGVQGAKRKAYLIGGPPTCQHEGCGRRAWYTLRGDGVYPRVCHSHKLQGMVQKTGSTCEILNCQQGAGYNFPGQKGRRRCGKHKEEGMFTLSSLCEVSGCHCVASYRSSEGQRFTRCSLHKVKGTMIPARRCKQPGCLVTGHYGYAGRGREFCKEHSARGMVHHPLVKRGPKRRR